MSQTRHFEFEAAILNPKAAVIQLTMRSPKNIWFCSEEHTNSKQAHKSKKLSSSYKRRGKTWKETEKRQKIVKIHFLVDGCYGNVNHHRHVIDTGKFSLTNFRKVTRFEMTDVLRWLKAPYFFRSFHDFGWKFCIVYSIGPSDNSNKVLLVPLIMSLMRDNKMCFTKAFEKVLISAAYGSVAKCGSVLWRDWTVLLVDSLHH